MILLDMYWNIFAMHGPMCQKYVKVLLPMSVRLNWKTTSYKTEIDTSCLFEKFHLSKIWFFWAYVALVKYLTPIPNMLLYAK